MAITGVIGVSAAIQARTTEFWDSFINQTCPEGTVVRTCRSSNIAQNRNILTEYMLGTDAEWIFYVDDDQIFAPDTLERLLVHQVPIVSGLYLQREPPFQPQVYDQEDREGRIYPRYLSPDDAGLIPVKKNTGAGCLLVRREVFTRMQKPYWRLGEIDQVSWTDDVGFCKRAREAGLPIHVDVDIVVGHKADATVWPQKTKDGWVTTIVIGNQPVAQILQPVSPLSLVR